MAWRSSGNSNAALVANLQRNEIITSDSVAAAFLSVDRAHYAPRNPYQDAPQSIGYGVTISAPHMHALAIEHLLPFLTPGDGRPAPRVLDIGSGSGYLTHVVAELVGEAGGCVIGVEHMPALKEQAEENMRKSESGRKFLESGRVKFFVGDGRLGAPPSECSSDATRFDAIHVGASAVEVHQALLDQLQCPGRIFMPLDDNREVGPHEGKSQNQHVWTIEKDTQGQLSRNKLFGVRYVPLTDAPKTGG